MKIGDVKDMTSQVLRHYQSSVNAGQSVERPSTAAQGPEEKVALSSQSRDLVQIKKAVDQLPEVREDVVNEIKNRIEQGTYRIQSDKIAEKMVAESVIDVFA